MRDGAAAVSHRRRQAHNRRRKLKAKLRERGWGGKELPRWGLDIHSTFDSLLPPHYYPYYYTTHLVKILKLPKIISPSTLGFFSFDSISFDGSGSTKAQRKTKNHDVHMLPTCMYFMIFMLRHPPFSKVRNETGVYFWLPQTRHADI
jgi:hypothetical protein